MGSHKPFYATVADRLIAQLEAGTAPWQKPWKPGESPAQLPVNPVSGKHYQGINMLQLMGHGYADPRWMTRKQAQSLGAQVRQGQLGTPIQYWKFDEELVQTDAQGRVLLDALGVPMTEMVPLENPQVLIATVFNAEQVDGLPPVQLGPQPDWSPVERVEKIIKASGAVIVHGEHNRAFYRPETDSIHLPAKAQFATPDNYYAVALHELGHWTGHVFRLDRDQSQPYGSTGYAREELRAEIASMMLGEQLGIGHDPAQHAAYVGNWIRALRDDPLEIFQAAADAEEICEYVLGLEQQQTLQQEQAAVPSSVEEAAQRLVAAAPNRGLDPAAKARLLALTRAQFLTGTIAQAQAQEQVAAQVLRQMLELLPATQPTPYMQAKGISPQPGVFTDRTGRDTYVPVMDANGKQWSLQTIAADGRQHFPPDSRKEGCFHALGGMAALARAPALVIGESYASAASLSQTLGFATVAALDAGNLPAVAQALHAKFPHKPVVIAGDDDRHLELTRGSNPGKTKAQEAAKLTGGTVLLPIFGPGENSYPAGLAVITPQAWRAHQRTGDALSAPQLAALARMQGKTDFNDLAQTSVLGQDGMDRQVRGVVRGLIDRQVQQQRAQWQPAPMQRGARLGAG